MTTKVTDEMLMAYVDGELDANAARDVADAIERDAMLASRARAFRETRGLARDAFAELRAQPVPEALVEAVMRGADDAPKPRNVVTLPTRRRWFAAPPLASLPLAASLALAFGLAGYWLGDRGGPAPTRGMLAELAEALASTPGGEARTLAIGGKPASVRALDAWRVADGLCRTFELSAEPDALRGIACDHGQGWRVDLAVAWQPGDQFSPASSAPTGSIDAFLDALGAEGPLTAEEEAAILRGG